MGTAGASPQGLSLLGEGHSLGTGGGRGVTLAVKFPADGSGEWGHSRTLLPSDGCVAAPRAHLPALALHRALVPAGLAPVRDRPYSGHR